jgi:hypothetical protein
LSGYKTCKMAALAVAIRRDMYLAGSLFQIV